MRKLLAVLLFLGLVGTCFARGGGRGGGGRSGGGRGGGRSMGGGRSSGGRVSAGRGYSAKSVPKGSAGKGYAGRVVPGRSYGSYYGTSSRGAYGYRSYFGYPGFGFSRLFSGFNFGFSPYYYGGYPYYSSPSYYDPYYYDPYSYDPGSYYGYPDPNAERYYEPPISYRNQPPVGSSATEAPRQAAYSRPVPPPVIASDFAGDGKWHKFGESQRANQPVIWNNIQTSDGN